MIGLLRQLLAAILSFLLVAPTFSYARNRLTNLAVNNSTASIESYAYTLDAAGHLLSVSELSGRTVNYGYDNLYRLTSETIASDPHSINGAVSYTYDSVGNRKQITSTLAPVPAGLWNYNANDQFTAGDFYDANGNTTSSGGIANVYDFENHLIQKGGVTIVYDGDGNRVSKTVTGITTTYLVDTLNPTGYAQVVYESFSGSSSGNRELNHSYVYGLELISQTRSYVANFNSATQKIYYVYDGHGSVRVLTDPTGAVTDTYDYDAFGNLVHSTGTTPNNYLFAGEQFDPDLNLYFNRARYLNTSTGRFWSMDTDEGRDLEPFSLHKYLYASGDPVDRLDPSGNDDLASLSIGSSIGNTLNNVTAIQGQAIMDQVKYGGNAGLKSLFFTGAILGGAIAIQGFGSIAREVPLLKAGSPGAVIINELSAEEAAFAEEIVSFRGGKFVGQIAKDTPGIDGFIEGVPASLKVLPTNSPQTVVDRVIEARDAAGTAGYFGAELFVSAKNIKAVDLLTRQDIRGADILGTIESIPREGIINAVNILTANGWLRFVR